MKRRKKRFFLGAEPDLLMHLVCRIALFLLLGASASAQTGRAGLNGKITDQTGAVIPQATVSVTGPEGKEITTTSDREGGFEIPGLLPGAYTVAARAKGFAAYSKANVIVTGGRSQTLNITLEIQTREEKVDVPGEEGRPQLDVSAASNASSLIIKGKDLEALSDDPDELQAELTALAGPAAGPNGGQIYIDGFTGGQLPPKSAIREIRINQNPFSAQYDRLGYGRIEIFTKPGSDKLHGQFFFNDSNSVFNSRNPFVFTPKPSYNTDIFDGNLGGPLTKKASFFLDASRRNINEFAAIHATDPDLGGTFTEALPNPRTRTSIAPRLDFQLSPRNTLTVRYQLTHDSDTNSGLSQFSLPSQAYNLNETEQTIQVSDTQILSPRLVNETRFQFQRETSHQLPISNLTAVQVQGAFTGGGNVEGELRNSENTYELQNYMSLTRGKHLIKFGGRLRGLTIANFSRPNFNGTFVFANVYSGGQLAATALQAYESAKAGNCMATNYSAAACPSQFSITTGRPDLQLNWFDAGIYAEDEWRVRPNLSFTYGLRYEVQNNVHDHADFAPRLGVAWGLGSDGKSAPKTVLRAAAGVFYDRFGWNLLEQAERLNGVNQQSFVIENPDFYTTIPGLSQLETLSSSALTTYQVSPDLRAPYTIQSAASVERQITKAATVSITYLNSRGEHAFYIRNINAPYVAGGPRPDGNSGNVYQYDSEGLFRQNQLIANARVALGHRISLFGFYTLNYADSNVGGQTGGAALFSSGTMSSASFLSNQWNPMADYGRASFAVRHRAFIGGSIEGPHGFRLSPFIMINSGQPYNITTGEDNNGDSIFNDRPVLLSAAPCGANTVSGSVYCTPLGGFDTAVGSTTPATSIVPINYGTGPGNVTLNLRLSKTIGLGREVKGGVSGAGSDGPKMGGRREGGLGPRGLSGMSGMPSLSGRATNRRYNLTFSISARNLLNNVNPGPPVGNLSSPFFAQSISIAGGPFSSASANRRVDLQVMFSF
ncbi:MAG: carboxypeptidase regulatory-like domain-containing protein [Acidobacteria bacterium]|nr:carboxypeptidase regulatory-like domain-containing protein [Acidobacteriota bacterium]